MHCYRRSQLECSREPPRRAAGFTLTELVVALAVAMVLMAISMPTFVRAYHAYQLTNASSQLADILRLTRYEAIRRNTNVNCVIEPYPADPTFTSAFADIDGNGEPGPLEKIILLGSNGNLVDGGGVPGTGALLAGAKVTSTPTLPVPGNATISFDSRGAATVGAASNVDAFYLANAGAPDAGFRAVLLMPAGSIQIWSGDNAGNWRQLR
jgi:Tfp pilus assembly protein FimT